MTTRELTAETTGPVTIDASLINLGGTITVHAVPDCRRATLTIRTADQEGAAADAVRRATLRQSGTHTLLAGVEGTSGTNSQTVITTRHRHQTVIGRNFGTITSMTFDGGDVIVNTGDVIMHCGATVITGTSPIEITAIVPEGSSVTARTHSADLVAEGALLNITAATQSGDLRTGHVSKVDAKTQSGDITIAQAAHITAKTQSGDLRLGRTDVVEISTMSGDIHVDDFGGTAQLKTMSGDIRVHATAGGDLQARTMSGDIHVTATDAALDDDLDVRAKSMSGDVRTPRRHRSVGLRRRSF